MTGTAGRGKWTCGVVTCLTRATGLQHLQSVRQLLKSIQVLVILAVQKNLLGVRKQTRNSEKKRLNVTGGSLKPNVAEGQSLTEGYSNI